MKSLLAYTFGYHDRSKRFVIATSYGQILFHKKGDINEAIVKLEVNSLYAKAMITIRIPKGKTMIISHMGKVRIGNDNTEQHYLLFNDSCTDPRKQGSITYHREQSLIIASSTEHLKSEFINYYTIQQQKLLLDDSSTAGQQKFSVR
jgi:hypothetical protein